jgi:riboflavin synthase
MFTGIVEDIGRVVKRGSSQLSVLTNLPGISEGESVAVNGVCLTITQVKSNREGKEIYFDFSPETEVRTNISSLRVGSEVNLERALKVGDRFGGHIMTGHIEGTGILLNKKRREDSWIITFSVTKSLSKYIAPKGSVGVDGISLTVVDSEGDQFSVAIIPYTMDHTNLGSRTTNRNQSQVSF